MISAFQDEILGFGLPISPENLKKINVRRVADGLPPFSSSPGHRALEFGKQKEGYWNLDHMLKQLQDWLYCAEVLFPMFQFVHNFDWSSGHSAMPPEALSANSMNSNFGGKQPSMRSSKIIASEGFLGPHLHDHVLKVGDIQHMVFQPTDPPPWYAPETPRFDTVLCSADGTPERNPDGTCKTTSGYVGKPKGLRQVLWERGFWNVADPKYKPTIDKLRTVLANCFDFQHEKTALERAAHDRGHLLRMTPKGHPELAGVGIEYSWGKAKMHFLRHNDLDPKTFHAQVLQALSTDVLDVTRVRKFARRARDYMRAYAYGQCKFDAVEKECRVFKTHRCAMDFDTTFIKNA